MAQHADAQVSDNASAPHLGTLQAENRALRAELAEAHHACSRARAVFQSAVDFAIVLTDCDGVVTEWNTGAARIFGWTAEEAVGQTPERLFTAEDLARGRVREEMQLALAEGRANDERWHVRKDGTRFWASGELMPLRDEGGTHIGFVKIVWDRTEQRQTTDALREAQSLTAPILESSRDCIVVLDLEARIQFVSPGGIAAMEIDDLEAVLGQSWLLVWTDDDRVAAEAAVAEARAGRIGRFQGYCATDRGRIKCWDVVISPIVGADGTVERLVSTGRDITDLKLTEQRLARLDERLDLALGAAAMVGIWDWDMTADRVYADANFARIYTVDPGRAREGAPLAEFTRNFHPDDLASFEAELARVIADDSEFSSEYRILQPDGSSRWLLARGRIIRDANGNPVRFPGASVDITERRAAELRHKALLDLGDRLRDLDRADETAFAAAEILGRALGVDRAGYGSIDAVRESITIDRDWTGPDVASIAGTLRFRDFGTYIDELKRGETVVCHDIEADARTAATVAALRSIDTRAFVNMPIFEHGSFVALLFLTSSRPRRWSEEDLAFLRDVADRVRAAIARRSAEADLRAIAASLEAQVTERTDDRNRLWQLSSDIMLVARSDGTITAVNPAWSQVLGWSEQELLGRPLFDLIHQDDLTRTMDAAKEIMQGEAVLPSFENRYRAKDGTHRWISWAAVPGGGAIHAVGRDVTLAREQSAALVKVEEALRQSQKMEAVGQLTGGLAHDFNNLLTGITGSLDLLNVRLAQGRLKELDRYITAAQGAAKRAAALTHRLLAFSRRQTLDPKPTDVDRLVAGMEDLIRRTIGPSITLEVVGTAALWSVMVDPNQLENALLNLCINARDAMPDGGRLTIETANKWLDSRAARERELPPGQYISLCVTDTGTGMPPDVIARAFDPFFTTKPLGQGTGLGLSMIYGFARQSEGQVRIYSEVGQGTTLCIYLPRHLGLAESEPDTASQADAPRAEAGETVLVVDDEPTVRMLVTEVLEDLGYTALEAADGASGLRVLHSDVRVDLLITDVGLPGGMNGRQVADAARVRRPDLKVLFITGYAENAVLGNGHLDRGMHVLTKPFAMEALASQIKDIVQGR